MVKQPENRKWQLLSSEYLHREPWLTVAHNAYRLPELQKREWFYEVDMSKYIAYIVDTLNHDNSISNILDPVHRIQTLLEKHKKA